MFLIVLRSRNINYTRDLQGNPTPKLSMADQRFNGRIISTFPFSAVIFVVAIIVIYLLLYCKSLSAILLHIVISWFRTTQQVFCRGHLIASAGGTNVLLATPKWSRDLHWGSKWTILSALHFSPLPLSPPPHLPSPMLSMAWRSQISNAKKHYIVLETAVIQEKNHLEMQNSSCFLWLF